MRALRILVTVGLCVLVSRTAAAQIIRPGSYGTRPNAFTSLSIGWAQTAEICDQPSNACWRFLGAPQWRVSLEKPVGRGAAFGVAGTLSRPELTYQGSGLGGCLSCDAHANLTQILATLRIGGGEIGFHQVIDLAGGVTLFHNFSQTSDGTRLGPGNTTSDPTFSLGYGFGFGFSQKAELMLVQEYGLVIHKNHMTSSNNTAQQYTTRVGLRFGLGGH
jgi:hypothetical protein